MLSTVVCDRFDYQGHTCNSIFDPSSYFACTSHATSGAESMNHQWKFSKSHLRFLRPDNLIPFLALRSIFVNDRACIQQKTREQDISILDFQTYARALENVNATHAYLRHPRMIKNKVCTLIVVTMLKWNVFKRFLLLILPFLRLWY